MNTHKLRIGVKYLVTHQRERNFYLTPEYINEDGVGFEYEMIDTGTDGRVYYSHVTMNQFLDRDIWKSITCDTKTVELDTELFEI